MRYLFPILLLISINAFGQVDCKKYIKLIEDKEGYDPSGQILIPIKIPIDDTSGFELSITGTGRASMLLITCYGIKPKILSGKKLEISLTNHENLSLLITGAEGGAIVFFNKGAADNMYSDVINFNDITELDKIRSSKIRGFRIFTPDRSIPVLFPQDKQEYFKNAIDCILKL